VSYVADHRHLVCGATRFLKCVCKPTLIARMREMQICWSLALQALAASSKLPASRPVLATNVDSYRTALIIAASHLHGGPSMQSTSTALRSRSFSQAAVAEQAQPDIQLTEAASEVWCLLDFLTWPVRGGSISYSAWFCSEYKSLAKRTQIWC